ncbi:MAG: DEAD/DEAH box helicase [Candidatus Actinomarina sp.]
MTFNLDKFQTQAIDSINKDFNVLVVAPTGSGKTYIAEKAIEKYTKQNQNVIYTTPIKALSNQKYNDFTNLNIDTGLLTGDRSIKPDSELIVATTEILRNMIYSNDERLKQIGLIVLDEVHYLSDSERGTTWEEIIIHAPKNIKFLFLSATIRNKEEFHNWIVSLRGKTALVYSNIRPVPLEISLVGLNPHNDQLKIIKSSKDKRNNKIFKFEKQYRKYKRPHLGFQLDYLDNKQLTPSIFFYFSRDRVETKARQATTNRKKIKEAEEVRKLFNNVFDSLDSVEYELLNLDELLWMWVRGVGYHHAGLAPIVKEFIEYLFLNRFIKYLFATETLSLGLNLPAKSIVIDRLYKFDGVKTRLINQSEFLQLTGRAGRRGIDTKGFAFINYDRNIENFWYNNLFTLKSSNLNSAYSVSYSSILNMLSKYSLNEAVELLENSFFAYQNNFNIKNLKKTFTSKLEVLELLKFKDNNKKSIVLTETYRDNLIVGLELLENEFNKDMNFYLMLVCSGLSTTRQVLSLNDIYMDTYVKFQIMEEKINKMESFAGVKNTTSIEIGWFSIFNEYLHSQDIELVLTKFNISIGDFIRAGKEASELSTKLFNIYKLKEFKIISDMFSNELIQKTMR